MGVFKDNENNGDSTDSDDETKTLLMQKDNDFKLGDKIYINEGEL